MDLYRELGLNLQPAVNAAEAGITVARIIKQATGPR
jgi:hypothetical protein